MQVSESVHVEHVREARLQAQVLEETREHVPGVPLFTYGMRLASRQLDMHQNDTHVEERRDEVDDYS